MKYMGGKSRLAKHLLPFLQGGKRYVEPFCGGCNMIDKLTGDRWANDSCFELIEMWRQLVSGWTPTKFTRDQYNHIRDNRELHPPHIVGWVGFNCSYSGKYFGGYAGETQTKEGVRDYQQEAINNVLKQVPKLRGVKFLNMDYRELYLLDCVVYCDPPYANTTGYKDGFDSEEFWEWVRATSRNNTVYVSEYTAPDDFICVWSKEVKSSLSANGKSGGSKASVEKLFKYA